MPRRAPLAIAVAFAALLAAPVGAQSASGSAQLSAPALHTAPSLGPTISHRFDGYFGVTYTRDGTTGESSLRPDAGLAYTVTLRHEFDSGLRFALEVRVEGGRWQNRDRHDWDGTRF